jgi:hypothetical protein
MSYSVVGGAVRTMRWPSEAVGAGRERMDAKVRSDAYGCCAAGLAAQLLWCSDLLWLPVACELGGGAAKTNLAQAVRACAASAKPSAGGAAAVAPR